MLCAQSTQLIEDIIREDKNDLLIISYCVSNAQKRVCLGTNLTSKRRWHM